MSHKRSKDLPLKILIGAFLVSAFFTQSEARMKEDRHQKLPYKTPSTAADPLNQLRTHNVGNIWLSISNYGQFGAETGRSVRDGCTGQFAPSCQFPAGSGVEYLYLGAIWIGAVVNDTDTLVSVGHDGWQSVFEMNSSDVVPIISRTVRPGGYRHGSCVTDYDSAQAISELDFIGVYYDTITDPSIVPPDDIDGPHRPLFMEITQKSYSWSYDYAKDFVLFDYFIKNIGPTRLSKLFMGIYIDADVYNPDFDGGGFTDDICGFRLAVTSTLGPPYEDTINVAWVADNDGRTVAKVEGDVFQDNLSPSGITGTRVVQAPGQVEDVKFSFNWWVSNGNPQLDFGPWRQQNLTRRPNYFVPQGQSGTPESDRSKYFIMSNNEFDYDQLFAALADIWEREGWVNQNQITPTNLADVADGYDTRYLLSFGPFTVDPDETLPLTLGYVAGKEFHVSPTDFNAYTATDSAAVFNYYDKLDFTAFGVNAQWVSWVYDNPGLDTDNDGFRGKFRDIGGDTIYYTGDGVPDFKGPPPPPPPGLDFESESGRVKLKWNGRASEETTDPFTNEIDFEGYRVLLSPTGLVTDYALLDSYDKIDYRLHYYDKVKKRWVYKLPSLSLDSLITLFQQDDPCGGSRPCPFDTLSFCLDPNNCTAVDVLRWTQKHPYVYQATSKDTLEISPSFKLYTHVDPNTGQQLKDSVYVDIQDWNRGLVQLKTLYKDTLNASGTGADLVKIARRDSLVIGLIGPNDDRYYDYEYDIPGLSPSQPAYLSVTTFDYGNPLTNLASLETSALANSRLIYPINSPQKAASLGKKVVVYPNPYKITEDYSNFPGSLDVPSLPAGRKIHFINLPPNYTIKIFTLAGDEVVTIRQRQARTNNCAADDNPDDAHDTWCLLSNNSQAVVSGIYLFTVEAPGVKTQIGKLVIIK
ncbi:MAG TPA: hypothetical protein VJ165_02695 [candidate division Zixibacteria bacterium]|nr:hypothetical protein [candidate division Zixibacteria bacterium]